MQQAAGMPKTGPNLLSQIRGFFGSTGCCIGTSAVEDGKSAVTTGTPCEPRCSLRALEGVDPAWLRSRLLTLLSPKQKQFKPGEPAFPTVIGQMIVDYAVASPRLKDHRYWVSDGKKQVQREWLALPLSEDLDCVVGTAGGSSIGRFPISIVSVDDKEMRFTVQKQHHSSFKRLLNDHLDPNTVTVKTSVGLSGPQKLYCADLDKLVAWERRRREDIASEFDDDDRQKPLDNKIIKKRIARDSLLTTIFDGKRMHELAQFACYFPTPKDDALRVRESVIADATIRRLNFLDMEILADFLENHDNYLWLLSIAESFAVAHKSLNSLGMKSPMSSIHMVPHYGNSINVSILSQLNASAERVNLDFIEHIEIPLSNCTEYVFGTEQAAVPHFQLQNLSGLRTVTVTGPGVEAALVVSEAQAGTDGSEGTLTLDVSGTYSREGCALRYCIVDSKTGQRGERQSMLTYPKLK